MAGVGCFTKSTVKVIKNRLPVIEQYNKLLIWLLELMAYVLLKHAMGNKPNNTITLHWKCISV